MANPSFLLFYLRDFPHYLPNPTHIKASFSSLLSSYFFFFLLYCFAENVRCRSLLRPNRPPWLAFDPSIAASALHYVPGFSPKQPFVSSWVEITPPPVSALAKTPIPIYPFCIVSVFSFSTKRGTF